jgi:hypothetical protein
MPSHVKIILITLLIAISGCQSAYYSAMEKVGKHKRDILIDRVENATDSQEEAKKEFKNALEQFSSLVNFDGGELQQQYEISNDHYHTSKVAAEEVSARINAIEDVAEALFNEWHNELEQFTNQSLKRQSQSRYNETQNRYATVIKSMRNAEKIMQPILNALKDNMLYLKHNLNARAIGELKTEYKLIEQDVERLINEMNNSINQSQTFIKSLKGT